MNVPVRSRPYTASRCGPGHSNEHACGRCNHLWNKMRRCGKVLGTKMAPIFAIKIAMDACSLSAAGNLQLYLPMRVVRFACQPQLPFRTIAAAMIYTGESCDDLLQASQTNWCRRLRHAANLVGFCSPFLTDF